MTARAARAAREELDVVIVGGGIGGSALGAALAEAGLAVEILERTTEFEDRVRGEWMAPWGVAEAKRLGLYEALVASGGHHLSRHIPYDEALDRGAARQTQLDGLVLALLEDDRERLVRPAVRPRLHQPRAGVRLRDDDGVLFLVIVRPRLGAGRRSAGAGSSQREDAQERNQCKGSWFHRREF